jgi:adenylate cyclase
MASDLERQLAECRAERDEALQRETATAEVLQVINSSSGDLAPVFDAILEKAHTLCGAAHGSLQLYDGENLRAVATHAVSNKFAEVLRQGYRAADSPASQALIEGQLFVQIADCVEIDHPVFRSAAELSGIRTVLFVPLRRDDAFLGLISAARLEVRPFTDKQIALLQNFAAQAVIALENARLLTETREALEQQTATAEVLQVINSSPGDLTPIFDAMLERATRLCEAAHGQLVTFDGECFRPVAVRGESRLADWLRQRGPARPGPGTTMARIVGGERLVHIADAMDDDAYRLGDVTRRALVEIGGCRTMLTVALHKDDALVGAISVYRQEVRPFSDKEIALLQNFAAQAVIAMENARLLTETREALEQQTATAEVLRVIAGSTANVQPAFDAIAAAGVRLTAASMSGIVTYDGKLMHLAAMIGATPEEDENIRAVFPIPADYGTATGRAILTRQVVHIEQMPAASEHAYPRLAQSSGQTVLAVPMLREGLPVGAINVQRRQAEPFTDKQIDLFKTFADQAVIAMENARLLGELRQRTDQIAELNRGLEARVAEQVEELGRVARLKRFLAPQLAELIIAKGEEKILESHRREIVVVFCDLRGYTAFTETAEPEEVLDFLREYHGALGPLVSQFEGTLDQFSGDGIMVLFNDPVPCPDPAERAVRMAMAMREAASKLIAAWRRHGCELGFGVGIAQGYATLGQIGFSERSGYTAIGTVCNLAARLCAEAKDGQILVSSRVAGGVEAVAKLEDFGNLELKGLRRPVAAFNVTDLI